MNLRGYSNSVVGLLCLATVIGPAGCAADSNRQGPPGHRIGLKPVAGHRRIMAQEYLHQWLRFTPASVVPAEQGRIASVSVPVRSTWTESPINLQYRFIFSDVRGKPMRTLAGFRHLPLQAGEQHHLEGKPLDPGAMDWQLEIRAAR
jgi:uncharacterized protein YcfL